MGFSTATSAHPACCCTEGGFISTCRVARLWCAVLLGPFSSVCPTRRQKCCYAQSLHRAINTALPRLTWSCVSVERCLQMFQATPCPDSTCAYSEILILSCCLPESEWCFARRWPRIPCSVIRRVVPLLRTFSGPSNRKDCRKHPRRLWGAVREHAPES